MADILPFTGRERTNPAGLSPAEEDEDGAGFAAEIAMTTAHNEPKRATAILARAVEIIAQGGGHYVDPDGIA